jgi:phospholipase/carboxylesterase
MERRSGLERRKNQASKESPESNLLDYVELNPDEDPVASIIWLHGLGADGHDFESLVPELRLPNSLPIRFVFPHAPERPVTINAGMVMRAWFDILTLDDLEGVDMEDLLESVDFLRDLIENEIQKGTRAERIVLAGFSQGGAVVLYTGLTYERKLAGLLGLSTYLPNLAKLVQDLSEVNQQIPVMMAHGSMDPMIPITKGIRTKRELSRLGYPVEWHQYPMMHEVCLEEISDISAWLIKILR